MLRNLFIIVIAMYTSCSGFSQSNNNNNNDLMNQMKIGDTTWIDINTSKCFTGKWTKIVIVKSKNGYEVLSLDNFANVLLEKDKVLLSQDASDTSFKSHINDLEEYFTNSKMDEESFKTFFDKLKSTIDFFKDCTSEYNQEQSSISITTDRIKTLFKFNCQVIVDFDQN